MVTAKFKTLAFLTVFLVLNLLFINRSPVWAAGSSYSLSPATASPNVGDTFAVDIVLDTGGDAASGATAILNYDTAKLQVIDDATGTGTCQDGINIKAGTIMSQCIGNTVNTTSGQIRFDAGNLGAAYTGRGVLATIHFKAIATGVAQVSFVFSPSSTTNTSQVAAASGPTNLLTLINDGSYTVGNGTTTETLPTTGVVEDTLMVLAAGLGFLIVGGLFAKKAVS